MHRIDFLGSPSAGKTTFLKLLLKQKAPKEKWLTHLQALRNCACRLAFQPPRSFRHSIYGALLKAKLLRQMHPSLLGRILNQPRLELILKDRHGYSEFFETVLEISSKTNSIEPAFKLMRLGWFLEAAADVILLEHSHITAPVVFDESLSHKVYDVAFSPVELDTDLVRNYFLSMPPPSVLIYCRLDPLEAYERARSRKCPPRVHAGLSEKQIKEAVNIQLEIARVGREVLSKRNVAVIDVDLSKTVHKSASAVLYALSQLS